ncbi:MAG: pyridoxal 5'-phosphate synthase [Burkholderiaceae bacterium]|nr:pyridoxal 5'-phosphate synthase [Microbacteriaceae bacterium]
MTAQSTRDHLRTVRPPKIEPLAFDLDAAPADPLDLFRDWLETAIDGNVAQANAMTLSTATSAGRPSARTLLLKDVTADGFWFASLSDGPKGTDLAENPAAALTFFWPEQGRQVRVTGTARPGPRATSEQDFLARHPLARAQAIAGNQSERMPPEAVVADLVATAQKLLDSDPDFVPETWTAYVVTPEGIEFWQAVGHDQVRLGYRLEGRRWVSERLWP